MPDHIILFTDANLRGPHKHVFDSESNLNFILTDSQGHSVPIDTEFSNAVSSLAIIEGNWRFFSQPDFNGDPFPVVLGPGLYRFVQNFKLQDNAILSLHSVLEPANMPGDPILGHAVLFEHANFHGDHRHIFNEDKNLPANDFNDIASSIVVESGNWAFYRDSGFIGQGDWPVLGPGIYPWVGDLGIKDNEISSLGLTDAAPALSNAVSNHIVLFEHPDFRGAHKHVFAAEPNLNAEDDDSFNDITSSFVVLSGEWSLFSDYEFIGPYLVRFFGPGKYPGGPFSHFADNDLSSLRPLVSSPVLPGRPITGHVIIFEDAGFAGEHRHILNQEDNLNADEDDTFNDSVGSLIVLSGNWKFFRNAGFDDDYRPVLGPGCYVDVTEVGILDDDMSSLKVVDEPATVVPRLPLDAHLIAFEYKGFRGGHAHIVSSRPFLFSDADSIFDSPVASCVIERSNWRMFKHEGFIDPFAVFAPGLYSSFAKEGLPSNAAAEPTTDPATRPGVPDPLNAHVILFEHPNFRGAHKHVFAAEPNLNSSDDNDFNDEVSSVAVLMETWRTFKDANFLFPYDAVLSGGLYDFVPDFGITDNDMSSLELEAAYQEALNTALG